MSSAKARLVAEYYGTDHHELHLVGKDMTQVIEGLVQCHDEPFGDAADIPLVFVVSGITRLGESDSTG